MRLRSFALLIIFYLNPAGLSNAQIDPGAIGHFHQTPAGCRFPHLS